ncbi:MAG: hypothetical protein HYY67_01795 [Thaumarchaeota archaeon]|nr:hypothetical protein [Nitrososphaerota archaeon]
MRLFPWSKSGSKEGNQRGMIYPIREQASRKISKTDFDLFFEAHLLEKPLTDSAQWSSPKIPLSKMVEAYETVVSISFGIDFLTEAIVGPGFYVSASNENIKDYISSYVEEIRLDSFNAIVTQEKLAYGNSIFEKGDGFDLKWLPISTLRKIYWDANKEPRSYEFLGAAGYRQINASDLIHFTFRRSNASPFGLGLIHQLLVERTYNVKENGELKTKKMPSIVDIDSQAIDDIRKILHRYLRRTIYNFPGASSDVINQNKSTLKVLNPEEDFVGTNAQAQEIGGQRSYDIDGYIDVVQSLIIQGIQNPVGRLFSTPGFTYASVDAILEAAERKIMMFQRDLKRDVENLLLRPWYSAHPWINANGVPVPWSEARVRVNWGIPEVPELDPMVVLQAASTIISGQPLMRIDEARENLKNLGYKVWELGTEGGQVESSRKAKLAKASNWDRFGFDLRRMMVSEANDEEANRIRELEQSIRQSKLSVLRKMERRLS